MKEAMKLYRWVQQHHCEKIVVIDHVRREVGLGEPGAGNANEASLDLGAGRQRRSS